MSVSELNIDVFRAINDVGKQYAVLNPGVVFIAEYMVYFLGLGLLVYWFTRNHRNRMMVIQAMITFIIAEILGKLAGLFYSHYQPFAVLQDVNQLVEHAIDNSFPSDHSILFFSICASFWLMRKKEGWLWLVLAVFVGLSRVWVGVHYPVDVITGALLGIVSALFVYWAVPRLALIQRLLALYEKIEQQFLPAKNKSKNF
ncbi:undecaprenyl-diphosphatase [Brevibacillus laterosporus]|uniref:undecaprenyl-diphosphatase n=1 Tax=Brevibacillus laterosporus TaxID=1465 RepID=UPI0035A638E9